MTRAAQTVVILGAGVNGCALARELALNGLNLVVVDVADIAGGTTAYSSRLIHGGLRYLEFGEFGLVRESLAERGRLLRLAPHLVKPLELFIPVSTRLTGIWQSARRFLGWPAHGGPARPRGLLLVRLGLWLYDLYARDRSLPRHRVERLGSGPPVDPARYHWLASYYDGQVTFPERLALALLTDAVEIAAAAGNRVEVFTYSQAQLEGQAVVIRPVGDAAVEVARCHPAAVINATGAWVDETLERLAVPSERLMGGTKGSHFLTAHAGLKAALAGRAIYAEASDGRPVFILPLADMTLVGTTDEEFAGDPRQAVASAAELDYLLAAVREIFPQFPLMAKDIAFSYSGVRPLPHSDAALTAAISREHFLKRHPGTAVPLYSIVGGKLTTCRSLAEECTDTILHDLGLTVAANSRERVIPGGAHYPTTATAVLAAQQELATQAGLSAESVAALWRLFGTRTSQVLGTGAGGECIRDTQIPAAAVDWVIAHQWVRRLDDLVERRLMLLYDQRLTVESLRHLAERLVAAGRLAPDQIEAAVAATRKRLATHFGRELKDVS